MKLIDADRMKMQLNNATVLGNFKEPFSLKFVLEFVDCLPEALISCPKCHGKGEYEVAHYEDDELLDCVEIWESRHCELCYGTGKVSVEFYEMIQEKSRGKK